MIFPMTQPLTNVDYAWIENYIDRTSAAMAELKSQAPAVNAVATVIKTALLNGGKLLTAGNGGSAAEALHLAEELTGRYSQPDRRALPAICLAADGTALTCIANDWEFSKVFSRQVEAFANPQDVLVLFSTSGNSENLIAAARAMRDRGGKVVGLLGRGGGRLRPLCDLAVVAAGEQSGPIQECHQVILHLILEKVEHNEAAV